MDHGILWAVIGLVLVIVELLTGTFYLLMLGIAAFGAAAAAWLGLGFSSQSIVAALVAGADGEKQAAVLRSEGEKQAAINKAQGEATAIRVIAEATAAGVRAVAPPTPNRSVANTLLTAPSERPGRSTVGPNKWSRRRSDV
jgi:membrane protein implicated in regulation of membrane protease activity